ncbi:hypothetical protein RHMOL_Rhmol04G0111600 [Rhododendron molle]|uniref:Uncharacterized protein n=1 Tax=Rhododendron molle TaxID=49168 RepID=A0ACC0NZ82_RHOML|nr:hypothetical protein RHMOL_Rhmol04G0111600 [Rhododendron molle]
MLPNSKKAKHKDEIATILKNAGQGKDLGNKNMSDSEAKQLPPVGKGKKARRKPQDVCTQILNILSMRTRTKGVLLIAN